MLEAILWGLVQGLTEFLPVSSSGHLVLVPAFLSEVGVDVAEPTLGVSAVLHLGTLVAVLIFFRSDLVKLARFARDIESRRVLFLLALATIPAAVGFFVRDAIAGIQENPRAIGIALLATTVILIGGQRLARGSGTVEKMKFGQALFVGLVQAAALIPGISRSGATIAAGNAMKLSPQQSARFSFLLGIPAIAAAGATEMVGMIDSSQLGPEILVAALVAALSGYLAIAFLLRALRRYGLMPFAVYTAVAGLAAIVVL